MGAGPKEFLARLREELPEVVAQIRPDESGLLHLEVAAFRRASEEAMDAGRLWAAERHFRLVEKLLGEAGPELRNALEVSYLEDLALGELSPARRRAVRERMPRRLREKLAQHRREWLEG
jgi:hypothetical protein